MFLSRNSAISIIIIIAIINITVIRLINKREFYYFLNVKKPKPLRGVSVLFGDKPMARCLFKTVHDGMSHAFIRKNFAKNNIHLPLVEAT